MSDMKKMGVLGPLGTHSEAAAQYLSRLLPERPELLVYPDIFAVIQAVEDGEVDSCLVPVENSLEGAINITLDTLARSDDLFVASELIWPVHNQLMARPGTQKICRIYSHPQPISQCRSYLQQHYPEAELIKVASTARAAEIVAKEPRGMGAAAICTKRGGELNGLVTVATEIQDNMANATRFFELRRVTAAPQAPIGPAEKMLVICEIDGQKAGALYDVLKEFADRGVNMTRIESRPARTELGAYIFFFDLDVADNEEALRTSVEAVARKSKWLKDLGSFPVVRANP
ncbi:prephenate dehydratase [Mitsuokella jalaludinii]|uniref:prephenate dehydratase n=1 Tax=Mitsuokella jalaludinii TaxID=187979 RepID=UPI00259510AC|nr:prephenate dehydratase [uncultured Mitsuokella sp.]MCI6606326.1 prephenate dehydratase [Mitsuokella jalaludinii]